MYLDFSDGQLILTVSESELKPREVRQFMFWGVVKNNPKEYVLSKDIKGTVPKLLQYLEKKEISYSFSPRFQELLRKINALQQDYETIFDKGRTYKDGSFDKKDYQKHLDILQKHVPRELREHQKKASYHLWLLNNAANFSVPGSGKTTVVLSVYERLRMENKVNKLFVIGPPASFGPWKEEFQAALGRKVKSKVLAGGNREDRKLEYYNFNGDTELYLTSFQTLLNDSDDLQIFLGNEKVRAYLVIDEAHYIKQINGSWANAALKVAKYADYRCILTGTPAPKSYTDLYNLFDFLWPERKPISSRQKARIKLLEENNDNQAASEILEDTIGPLFYRVRKKELGLADQIFHPPHKIEMNPSERLIYNAIINKIRDFAIEDYLKNIQLVNKLRRGRMIRLRQCISNAQLLSTAVEDYDEDIIGDNLDLNRLIIRYDKNEVPAKLSKLVDLVSGFQKRKEKIVIWSNFLGTISLIENTLEKKGYECKKIIGETPVENSSVTEEETREKIRLEFVDPKSGLDILIANPAACAESISLHKSCSNAIYYDLSYNCAQYLQSLDRIHRVGGSEEKSSHYHYLQYSNTIDSDILLNLNRKAEKMYEIIEGDYNIYSLDMFDDTDEINAYQRLFADDHE
ncbi:MAG: DEAD/DEAH box helicase [Bacteroidota bacterium]|nr:DEAD/DEAH box helicase [Bacteroidota bacterium]